MIFIVIINFSIIIINMAGPEFGIGHDLGLFIQIKVY